MSPQRIDEFHQARTKRLRTIELQIASYGEMNAPVHLLTERDAIKEELADAERAMQPSSRRELIEAMDPVQRHIDMERRIMEVQAASLEVRQELRQEQRRQDELREMRQRETDQQREQTRRWLAGLTSAIVALIGFRVRDLWREWVQR